MSEMNQKTIGILVFAVLISGMLGGFLGANIGSSGEEPGFKNYFLLADKHKQPFVSVPSVMLVS